jgi:hypothetical protein
VKSAIGTDLIQNDDLIWQNARSVKKYGDKGQAL